MYVHICLRRWFDSRSLGPAASGRWPWEKTLGGARLEQRRVHAELSSIYKVATRVLVVCGVGEY